MKAVLLSLGIAATLGVFVADFLLLGVPAFRNGWASLAFFAVPAGLILLGSGGETAKKLRVAAWIVLVAGIGGYVALRKTVGIITEPVTAVVGGQATDFTLKGADGKDVRLSHLASGGKVVLVFFRGAG